MFMNEGNNYFQIKYYKFRVAVNHDKRMHSPHKTNGRIHDKLIHSPHKTNGAQSTELVSLYIGYWTLNNYYYYYY